MRSRQRAFDRSGVEAAAFVQQSRGGRAEAAGGRFVRREAHAAQRSVQRVFRQWAASNGRLRLPASARLVTRLAGRRQAPGPRLPEGQFPFRTFDSASQPPELPAGRRHQQIEAAAICELVLPLAWLGVSNVVSVSAMEGPHVRTRGPQKTAIATRSLARKRERPRTSRP